MNTIGRNDPCPCGSGRKYKKCCGDTSNVDTTDLRYSRIRRLDTESGNLVMRFAKERYGQDVLEKAWEDFLFSDEIPFVMSHPDIDFFLRWFTFDWKPQEKEKLSELFLIEKGTQLSSDLRHFIEATSHAAYSFFQTLEAKAGIGLTLRDILRKYEIKVTEKSASTILERGHIVYARIVQMDETCFIMGCGTHVFPPTFLDRLQDLRTLLEKDRPTDKGSITVEILQDSEGELRGTYFRLADNLKNRKFEIRNNDGEPFLLHTLTYDIPSFERPFHSLKDLEQKMTGRTDKELLAEVKRNTAGEPTEAYIHWLKSRKKVGSEGATSLASIMITPSTLVVTANSEKRSKLIQKEINKRLGDDAVLLRIEITPLDGILKGSRETRKDTRSDEEIKNERLLNESPEVKALLSEKMEKHWASWSDTPLPALRGMTPRRASKDPQGRELLDSLLMEFELRNKSQKDEYLRVNTAKLRRDLGIEPIR